MLLQALYLLGFYGENLAVTQTGKREGKQPMILK